MSVRIPDLLPELAGEVSNDLLRALIEDLRPSRRALAGELSDGIGSLGVYIGGYVFSYLLLFSVLVKKNLMNLLISLKA